MRIDVIKNPIASRQLNAGETIVTVTIGRPEPCETGKDYSCPFLIECDGEEEFGYAVGVDGVQAIQLAMKKIGIELELYSAPSKRPLTWLDNEPGYTGF